MKTAFVFACGPLINGTIWLQSLLSERLVYGNCFLFSHCYTIAGRREPSCSGEWRSPQHWSIVRIVTLYYCQTLLESYAYILLARLHMSCYLWKYESQRLDGLYYWPFHNQWGAGSHTIWNESLLCSLICWQMLQNSHTWRELIGIWRIKCISVPPYNSSSILSAVSERSRFWFCGISHWDIFFLVILDVTRAALNHRIRETGSQNN